MDGAVGELALVRQVPQVHVLPAVGLRQPRHDLAVLVVGPARVIEIVAQVAVHPLADQDRLVDEGHRHAACKLDPRRQHVQRQRGRVQGGAGAAVEGHVGVEVALRRVVFGRVHLVDAGGAPHLAVQLQADQVSQRAAGAHQGAVPEGWGDQGRVGRVQCQVVGLDQAGGAAGVVSQQRRVELQLARQPLQRHHPDDAVGLVALHRFLHQHQVLGHREGGVAQVVGAHGLAARRSGWRR